LTRQAVVNKYHGQRNARNGTLYQYPLEGHSFQYPLEGYKEP